jgi:uncharacterized protein (TIGR02444 family)
MPRLRGAHWPRNTHLPEIKCKYCRLRRGKATPQGQALERGGGPDYELCRMTNDTSPKPQPIDIDNPFWQFSLRVYAAPGVAPECLQLQERLGLDVNVVLFAAWLGLARGVGLRAADLERISAATAGWSGNVVKALRTVRKNLKPLAEDPDSVFAALRKRVAGAELLAEQIEQAQLYAMAETFGATATAGLPTARGNIAAILAACDGEGAFPLRSFWSACEAERG